MTSVRCVATKWQVWLATTRHESFLQNPVNYCYYVLVGQFKHELEDIQICENFRGPMEMINTWIIIFNVQQNRIVCWPKHLFFKPIVLIDLVVGICFIGYLRPHH
jgi:hypothetical protein